MPLRVRNKTNNAAAFFAPLATSTSQFAPPTVGEAGEWLPNDVDIINATQAVATALSGGQSRTLTFRNNATNTGSSLVLAAPDASVRGIIDGTLAAAVSEAQSSSHLGRQLDAGSPPTEASRICIFYNDPTDEDRSWLGFGSPSFNQSVSATPEYFGIDQNRTTTTEAQARVIVPVDCTLETVFCRYGGTVGTDHELAAMVNGVATVIGTLTGNSAGALFTFTPNLALSELDELSFRVVRSAGAATAMVLLGMCAFIPDEP